VNKNTRLPICFGLRCFPEPTAHRVRCPTASCGWRSTAPPESKSQRLPNDTGWTHDEDMKDPVEDTSPRGDRIFVFTRADGSRDPVPSILLDDVTLDLSHSSAIGVLVNGALLAPIVGATHDASCSIATRTEELRSSIFFPLKTRSRA
jgi:hypothetical protein